MSGAIMPEPLQKPMIVTSVRPMRALRTAAFGKVSVVMMARRARSAPPASSDAASAGSVASIFSTGSFMPITPVDETKTSSGLQPSSAAVRKARGTVAPIADAVVAAGRFGQKTSKGWYMYDEKRNRLPDPEVERIILDVAEKMQVRRRKIEADEILERLLLPMVNEGARILEEGIASRPIDIDVIFTNGFGWPAWRGGPMFWADTLGLKAVRDKLNKYAEATGDKNLRPAALIEKLADEGGSFAAMGKSKV